MAQRLGRGLASLIPPTTNQFASRATVAASSEELQHTATLRILDLPLHIIDANPLQPRQDFDAASLRELADSIQEYGLLEPIVVTPVGDRYHVVAGERRLRAHRLLHKKTIPAIIRSSSELEKLALALIENIQRADLNPMEKAGGLKALVNDFGLTQEEAAKKLGVARSTLANSIRLLDLPPAMQIALADGVISEGHAKILLGIRDAKEQERHFQELVHAGHMSVRDFAARSSSRRKTTSRMPGPFDSELQDLQEQLQQVFGTKVRVQRVRRGTQITIETFSDDELKSVVQKMITSFRH